MGYYTQYLSTLFKGPWATSIKERLEAKKAIRNLKASDKKLYKDLPRLVEKEHRVTKALKEEDKVIRELKEAAAQGYSLAFNVSTMDMNVLEAISKFIDAWNKVHEVVNNSGLASYKQRFEELSKLFVISMQKAVKKAEEEEREEYKNVMILVDESEKKDHSQFMQAVRLRFQSLESQSTLAKFAIRSEIRQQRQYLSALQKIAAKCEQLHSDIASRSKSGKLDDARANKTLAELESIAKQSAEDIKMAFYDAYLIKKRDFLLMMKVVVNMDVLRQLNKRWIAMNFMPKEPVGQKDLPLGKIEEKISKEFHTIAQALRISLAALQKVEAKARRAA